MASVGDTVVGFKVGLADFGECAQRGEFVEGVDDIGAAERASWRNAFGTCVAGDVGACVAGDTVGLSNTPHIRPILPNHACSK